MTKGERIKKLRIEKGITQSDMAKALNTTKQAISKYENGIVTNIPSDKIEGMAKLLNSTPEYILGWEQIQKNNDTLTDIIVRARMDDDFFTLLETINQYDADKIKMLSAFLKQF